MTIRVGILGATGYTALELFKILLRHPHAKITVVTSRQDRSPIAATHPSLAGLLDLNLEDPDPAELGKRCDCVFSCLPHCASATIAPKLLAEGLRVVDLSADYRLDTAKSFHEWYGEEHPDPSRLGATPYGLPELFADKLPSAKLIANPGCYPTSAILPLAPFLAQDLIETTDIIVDSKSGVSGAGRTPKLGNLYSEVNESISAYSVGKHRHQPEIEQILGRATGKSVDIIFTPHLIPMDRGILSAIYVKSKKPLTQAEAMAVLRDSYATKPFVRIVDNLPATKYVAFSNYCDITARVVKDRLLLISCIDNLIKGASGAAVQNFNLMFGFPETTGLL
jgi:N-acetyl-gamma-glutamyl-phosphate reductase